MPQTSGVTARLRAAPTLIAVGPSGADLSSDEGRTWQRLDGDGFHAFSFAPAGGVGWGVGENGRIAQLRW
jgi:hypothetical protein